MPVKDQFRHENSSLTHKALRIIMSMYNLYMKKKDVTDSFMEDLMGLMRKYRPSGVVILIGVPEDNKVHQGAFVAGDPEYLSELVNESCANNPELHKVIDAIAHDHVEVVEIAQELPRKIIFKDRKVN